MWKNTSPGRIVSIGKSRATGAAVPAGRRQVCFDASGFVEAPTYRRADLLAGDLVRGPAVIEEYGSTVPLQPGFGATVDRLGNLVVRR